MRFLLIDRFTAWEPGVRAAATKNVALSEDFFDDHFPLNPVMPGVLILEGLAELAGLTIEEGVRASSGRPIKALLTIVERAKFRRSAHPGDTLEYVATVDSVNELGGTAAAEARIGGDLAAECRLVFAFREIENPVLERRRAEILALWMRGLTSHGSA